MRSIASPLLAALAVIILAGCSGGSGSFYNRAKHTVVDAKNDLLGTRPTSAELFKEDDTPLIEVSYDAADELMGLFSPAMNKKSPIYVSGFTNRVNPSDPAPFGKMVADQVAARLALRGFLITDGPAKPPAIDQPEPASPGMYKTGRDGDAAEARRIESHTPARSTVLSGSYLVADKVIYISAKLTAMDNGQVIAAHHWTAPINRNTIALLPQLKPTGGMKPTVRTTLGGSPSAIANPSGQPQNYVNRDMVR